MKILSKANNSSAYQKDFDYLHANDVYLDSACQTLRPHPVIDAVTSYYQENNACGGRVKYAWGRKVDEVIATTRKEVLKLTGKSERDYVCAFTLNTTYGINLILNQLPDNDYKQVVTSDIEHNSVFLPTISVAKRLNIPRLILQRDSDGTLQYSSNTFTQPSVVVVNAASNIDGRLLLNARTLAHDIHTSHGILIIDGAQLMGHKPELIKDVDFDALCFSGHKMYGPSIGIIVAKKSLLKKLNYRFVGGGMVENVEEESFSLLRDEIESWLEPGLQDFAAITGLRSAIEWHNTYSKLLNNKQKILSQKLYDGLKSISEITLINAEPSPIISFYSDSIDSHRLAVYLSNEGIMARSGYFCCHYFLKEKNNYPPLLRLSIGHQTTEEQIERVISTLKTLMKKV